jgi:hypothetical protein
MKANKFIFRVVVLPLLTVADSACGRVRPYLDGLLGAEGLEVSTSSFCFRHTREGTPSVLQQAQRGKKIFAAPGPLQIIQRPNKCRCTLNSLSPTSMSQPPPALTVKVLSCHPFSFTPAQECTSHIRSPEFTRDHGSLHAKRIQRGDGSALNFKRRTL